MNTTQPDLTDDELREIARIAADLTPDQRALWIQAGRMTKAMPPPNAGRLHRIGGVLGPDTQLQEVAEMIAQRYVEDNCDESFISRFDLGLFGEHGGQHHLYLVRFHATVELNPDPATLLPGSGGMTLQ